MGTIPQPAHFIKPRRGASLATIFSARETLERTVSRCLNRTDDLPWVAHASRVFGPASRRAANVGWTLNRVT
jgi:hypothetical protein